MLVLDVKCLSFISFVLGVLPIYSQTIRGVIVSSSTKTPISHVNIYFSNQNAGYYTGTFTDETGFFEIIPLSGVKDSLTISCIGYATTKLKPETIRDTVFLKEVYTRLSDITVKAKSAKDFLIDCVRKIPINYKNVLFRNIGFGWQVLKVNDVCKKLTQSFVTIEQQYLASGIKTTVSYDSTIENPIDSLFDKIVPQYYKLGSYLYFDLIRTGPSVLDEEYIDGWDFSYSYPEETPVKDILIIEAKNKGKFNDYKFYVNETDLAILKIEYSYSWGRRPSHLPLSLSNEPQRSTDDSVRFLIANIKGIIQYEKTNKKYNLKYLSNEVNYKRVINTYNWGLPIKWDECTLVSELIITTSKEYPVKSSAFNVDKKSKRTDFRQTVINKDEFEKATNFLIKRTQN